MKIETAVIGAGPAGLGAGHALAQGDKKSWHIFEATGRVGGLASSRVDKNGFTWDLGGHVIFSASPLFNAVVDAALGADALRHTRKSFIRMSGRFIPFPLQNNIHRLPPRIMRECLRGLVEAQSAFGKPQNFEQWIPRNLGAGIAKHFMFPYNRKLWAFPLDQMGHWWIDGRVAVPSVESIKKAVASGSDDHSWGPNAGFSFPLRGGTGGLFANIARPFIGNVSLRHAAQKIDVKKKKIIFSNGTTASYGRLVTTAPLDMLVKGILKNPPKDVLAAAGKLRSNGGWVVGIGINRKADADRCWVYSPDSGVPFYRVTYFSNYSPLNVPRPGKQASFMCEISSGPLHKRSGGTIISETVDGLIRCGIMREGDKKMIATTWKLRLPYLYPIPALGRDEALAVIGDYLCAHDIASVGRFGGWRYEEGNMDHSFLAGYSAVGW